MERPDKDDYKYVLELPLGNKFDEDFYVSDLEEYIDWLENNNKETYEVIFEEKENSKTAGTG